MGMASKLAICNGYSLPHWQLVRQLVLVLNLCVSFLVIEHILKSVTVCWSSSCSSLIKFGEKLTQCCSLLYFAHGFFLQKKID